MPFSQWYFGITNDPNKRVFEAHGVQRENQNYGWIFRECQNSQGARALEDYFIKTLGTKGGGGGGDLDSNYVYAYQITSYTNENI